MPFRTVGRLLSLHLAVKFSVYFAGRGRRPLGPGQSLPELTSPSSAPPTQAPRSHSSWWGTAGRQAQRIHIPLRVIAPKSILDNGSTMSARQRTQIRVDTVVSARLTLSLHSKTKTADGWMRFSELHHDWLPQHVSRFGSFFYWSVFLKPWTRCTSLVLNQRRPAFFVLDLARLGNYIFCLVTRNCFDYFIG